MDLTEEDAKNAVEVPEGEEIKEVDEEEQKNDDVEMVDSKNE